MFAKSEFVEHRKGVGCKNLPRRVPRIQCQQDRDQSAHDMRVAVAQIVQQRFVGSAAVDLLCEPNLAGAALHLVYSGMPGFRHGIQRAAEFDDIPIAVVPIVQERKIIPDFVDRHRVPALNPKAIYRIAGDRKRYNRAKMNMVPGLICSQGAARHSAIRSSGVNVSGGAAAANEAPPSSTPPPGARCPMTVAAWPPTSHAAGCRLQNWLMSDTAADAADTASEAPSCGSFSDSGVFSLGNSTSTSPSQNAMRRRT